MAAAALEILGLTERIAERLAVDEFVPAVGQGCVAVECRADDGATRATLAQVDDPTSRAAVEVERSYLAELGSGCSLPVGAHVDGDRLHVFLAASDVFVTGERPRVHRDTLTLSGDVDADRAAARAAARLAHAAVGG
jgi:hydroxymethylbilane synthase